MNSKYLSLPKTKKYIQKKYLQFKEIRNPKRQTIYFVYYGTVGCFSIGIIADLCVYLIRKDLLLALCNILSLGLFLLFTYLLIRKKKQITFLLKCTFYTIQSNILISMYCRIYLPPEETGFFLSQDLMIGMVTCGLASISVSRHTVMILSFAPILLYMFIGVYTSSELYLMSLPSLAVAYIFPPIMLARLQEISGITSKNGRNDAKRLNIRVVMVSNDDKPKNRKTQRKADLRRRMVCKSLPVKE